MYVHSFADYAKMSAEDYSKLTSDQWSKMTPPPLVSDGYAKLTDHNWNQSYASGPSVYHAHAHAHAHPQAHPHAHHHHHHHLAAANNEYAHQMQAGGYGNAAAKYWS